MGSIGSAVSCAAGCCFGVLSAGAAIAGGFCLAHAKTVDDIFDKCCGETNQYNNHYPCPDSGLKERASFCKQENNTTDKYIKIGAILLGAGIGLCCISICCGVLSSACKREGYQRF